MRRLKHDQRVEIHVESVDRPIACRIGSIEGAVATLTLVDRVPSDLLDRFNPGVLGYLLFEHGRTMTALKGITTAIATEGSDEGMILRRYEDALPEFLNVSQVTVQSVAKTKDSAAVLIKAEVAAGAKCERCWRVVPDVGSDNRWSSVCSRCAEALDAINFPPTQEAQ